MDKKSNTFLTLIGILLQLVKYKMDTKKWDRWYLFKIPPHIYIFIYLLPRFKSPHPQLLKYKKKKKTIYSGLCPRNPFATTYENCEELIA